MATFNNYWDISVHWLSHHHLLISVCIYMDYPCLMTILRPLIIYYLIAVHKSVVNLRKLGGEASLTEKFFTFSNNRNYIHLTVLPLSNHWPSNKIISFEGHLCKKKNNNKAWYYFLFLQNAQKTHWSRIKMSDRTISTNVFIAALPFTSNSNISIFIYLHLTLLGQDIFPMPYPITENEFGRTGYSAPHLKWSSLRFNPFLIYQRCF